MKGKAIKPWKFRWLEFKSGAGHPLWIGE